tara:strand:+ start:116 stop:568 length:453 start_codon:yes stop_codon:yes gene_type:complete
MQSPSSIYGHTDRFALVKEEELREEGLETFDRKWSDKDEWETLEPGEVSYDLLVLLCVLLFLFGRAEKARRQTANLGNSDICVSLVPLCVNFPPFSANPQKYFFNIFLLTRGLAAFRCLQSFEVGNAIHSARGKSQETIIIVILLYFPLE